MTPPEYRDFVVRNFPVVYHKPGHKEWKEVARATLLALMDSYGITHETDTDARRNVEWLMEVSITVAFTSHHLNIIPIEERLAITVLLLESLPDDCRPVTATGRYTEWKPRMHNLPSPSLKG